ncbi:BtrH N-terminal domain-containing protein [Actinoplanes sp. NBC_00393]|uniref:BtrH N-terminal domain-containing protein n=1 Tax=Actinoplanes sp. NBC_00393 TaxID=2975953 RepID=UPI002E23BEE4
MTTHRNLKRLVRERAARTGESYTTARRNILGRRGLVPGYGAFGGGEHHESTLLAHLLRQAGHRAPHTGEPYSEATLCGLAGGVGFLYAVFAYTGLPPILTIVAQHHPEPWAQAALDRLKIGYEVRHNTAPGPARRDLDATIDAGRPMLCTVGRGGLPWHQPANALDTDPYQVVVAGRDGDHYLVDDLTDIPHAVPAEVFVAAWSAHRKGRHERLVVSAPDGPVDLAAGMRAAIGTTVAHLTGPVLGNAFDVNMGFSGMARLAADLRDEQTKRGWARRFAEPGALAFALLRLYECLELQYTAPAGTRPLYADFLDEAAGVLGEPRIGRAAALFRTSGEQWAAVAEEALAGCGPAAEILERRLFAQLTGAPLPPPPTPADLSGPGPGTDRAEAGPGAGRAETGSGNPRELLSRLADHVEAALSAEKAAVHLLQT